MTLNEQIIKRYWGFFNDEDFDAAGGLMVSDAVVWWPNTREVFKGKDKFILVQKKYPGKWYISLEKIFSKDDIVITVVNVEAEDKSASFYATSFFKMKNSMICEIHEYWGDVDDPPEWRIKQGLSERY
ncbi:nuclear transport factor 2 family protein [candidate division WOR-3 bacterium]|nr:nuclear transport factor 2 family protein [candidate division WOR-3 bacterium]